MGVKHGLGIACFAFVIGFGMAQFTEDGTMIFCWICGMPLTLAGLGFVIPDRPKTIVVHPPPNTYSPSQVKSFEEVDTNRDGVITRDEYYR